MNLSQNAIKDFNPLNDYYFKTLMGKPERKDLTLNFLNSLYGDETQRFRDIVFLDKDFEPTTASGKLSRLDIRAVLDTGTQIDIEVQICREKYMSERSLYYWSRMYSNQLNKGNKYKSLKPAISIIILDFDHLTNEANWHNSCHITIDASKRILTNHLEMHFLEIPKIKISDVKKFKKLDAWGAYLTGKRSQKDIEVLMMSNPAIKKALEYENYFTNDDVLRREYEKREDAIRDENSRLGNAIDEGIEIGLEKAKRLGIINGLKSNIDVNIISAITGASIDTIEQIKKSMAK